MNLTLTYDFRILDIQMMKMNGFELYIKRKEEDHRANIMVFSLQSPHSMKILEKHNWHWVKQSLKTTLFKSQSKTEDLINIYNEDLKTAIYTNI